MKAIGLTGGIASGKTTVCNILKEYGIPVISADEQAHQAIKKGKPVYEQILKEFGSGVLEDSQEIDRKKLGEIVFKDAKSRQRLEEFIHPQVITEIRQMIIESRNKEDIKLIVFEIPLLFEAGMEEIFDQVWVISVSPEKQYQRLMHRNSLSTDEAKQRIDAQLPLRVKEGKADIIIYNNQGIDFIKEQINQILKNLGVIPCIDGH